MKNKLQNMIKQKCKHRSCHHSDQSNKLIKSKDKEHLYDTDKLNSKLNFKFKLNHNDHQSKLTNKNIIIMNRHSLSSKFQNYSNLLFIIILSLTFTLISSQQSINSQSIVTFEKLTNRDYSGYTYYTIRNVSLYECLGWCREEDACNAAVFSFIVNPLAPIQDTTCKLLNETVSEKLIPVPSESTNGGTKDLGGFKNQMNKGGESQILAEESTVSISLQPQKAANLYFFTKIKLDSESVCNRLWSFERYPNKILPALEKESVLVFKSTKDACLTSCSTEQRFVCRSAQYNYPSNLCYLSQFDRRTVGSINGISSNRDLVDQEGFDYFENSCIESSKICLAQRDYQNVNVGLPQNKISYHVEINYYPDKELLVKSKAGCSRACTVETEFICRSILFRANYVAGQPNCALYHLDHYTLPDGLNSFSVRYNAPLPLFDTGDGSNASYYEATCLDSPDSISQQQQQQQTQPIALPSNNRPTIVSVPPTTLPPTKTSIFSTKTQQPTTTQYQEQTPHQKHIQHAQQMEHKHSPFKLTTIDSGVKSSQMPTLTTTPNFGSLSTNTLTSSTKVHHHSQVVLPSKTNTNSIKGVPSSSFIQQQQNSLNLAQNITIGTTTDPSCDSYGVCYTVSLKCTDTRIRVDVKTSLPFHGRIYALGRSETCNNKIHNSQHFSLEMSLTGPQCSTQNLHGVYSNTVVLQHHNVVLTKADKVYHVRCTYETTARNVTFGIVPVRDAAVGAGFGAEPVEISASPEAPAPRIVIESSEGREASTVRVGDKLTFRIEIPKNSIYGIFARSCFALAKDSVSTFEIIDENGCPVDSSIFPAFQMNENALESTYEAFRFTESYGVIFQCNVKYCIGKCEPYMCNTNQQSSQQGIFGRDASSGIPSYGRRRRRDLKSQINLNDRNNQSNSDLKRIMNNRKVNQNNNKLTTRKRQARGKSREEELLKNLKNDEMTLSREILVLDMNPSDSELSDSQRSELDYTTLNAKELMSNMDHCASTTSLMALCLISGLLVVLYVCTVAYFTTQQRNYQKKCKNSFY